MRQSIMFFLQLRNKINEKDKDVSLRKRSELMKKKIVEADNYWCY